jgi:hypothetical protein
MKDLSVAFYFIGHGTLREPRLIELQHMRVLRYRDLAPHPDESFSSPRIFIDLNQERRNPTPESFPQFYALISAIREGAIGMVYLDVHEEQSPSVSYSWVRMYLEAAGAKVINVFYDEDRVFENAVKQRYGLDASPHDIDDASDFVCFFPRCAFHIAAHSMGGSPIGMATAPREEMLSNWYRLKELHPYARGETPFVEARLERIWNDLWSLRRKTEQAERKETDTLYQIRQEIRDCWLMKDIYPAEQGVPKVSPGPRSGSAEISNSQRLKKTGVFPTSARPLASLSLQTFAKRDESTSICSKRSMRRRDSVLQTSAFTTE